MDDGGESEPHPDYQDGNANDVVITYLCGVQPFGHRSPDRVHPGLSVVREPIGDKLSMKQCAEYLHWCFPHKTFSHKHVARCYDILLLVIKKATHVECMDDNRTDVCFEDWFLEAGVFTVKRRRELKYMFASKRLTFACYNVNDQDNEDWHDMARQDIDQQRGSKYPTFTMKQLLEHDWAYEIFCEFWEKVRDHEETRKVLQPFFPKDIIDVIFSKLTNVPKKDFNERFEK